MIVITIVFDLVTFAGIFVAIGHDSNGSLECISTNNLCPSSTVPLGTWKNFPSTCNSGSLPDSCELMGNSSYRGLLVIRNAEAGITVGLSVGCITPSKSVGAALQLQYANYTESTHTNSTNFVNIGGTVLIDNSAGWSCPGTLDQVTAGTLPSLLSSPNVFVFRVMGLNGGGPGDNPRFSSAQVYINQLTFRTLSIAVAGITTVHFLFIVYATFAYSSATTITVQWIATNVTATSCITESACIQHGSSSCTFAAGTSQCPTTTVTFATVFTGTPNVVTTVNSAETSYTISIGTIQLLSAQTLTV